MVAGLREGQIGKQPGRPLRVSAPSHFWLCKEAVERLCYNNRKIERETVKKKKKLFHFFFSTAEFFVVRVSKRMRLDMKYSNLSGRTWGRASSTCGWKRFVNSWWRNRGAQTQVRLGEWMVDRRLLYQAAVTQGWIFIDLCFYRLVPNQWEQEFLKVPYYSNF